MILIQEDGALNAQINSNQEDPSSRSLVHHHSKCKLSLLLWGLVFTTICTRSQATGTNPSTQQPAPQAPETETETADHRQQQAFAVCAVVKDRPAYVAEWLDYHAALGVQKFYLFDTDNPDHSSLRSALQAHIDAGRLELYNLPRVNPRTIPMMQLRLYDMCLQTLRDKHLFIGFWDVDEFLVIKDPGITFPDFLIENYSDKNGLVVNWRVVGSSGHVKRPANGGVLENYVHCAPTDFYEHYLVKSIVNTCYVLSPTSDPHSFFYNDTTAIAYTVDHLPVDGPRSDIPAINRLALYHYAIRSREDFGEKLKRGSAMGNRRGEAYFQEMDEAAKEVCEEAREACRRWGLVWCDGGGRKEEKRGDGMIE